MIRSPSASPSVTIQSDPCACSTVSARSSTVFCAFTTSAVGRPRRSRPTASCGTRMPASSRSVWISTRTYMPGKSSLSGFGNDIRSTTTPVCGSTCGSAAVTTPVDP